MGTDLCPIVSEEDVPIRCADQALIQREGWPHRVVWGLLYSPETQTWLVQWRRPTKYISPSLWDVSWAGHVSCVQGQPESYLAACARELREELGLEMTLVDELSLARADASRALGRATTYDLGYSREYHAHPIRGGGQQMFRAHAHHFLAWYDGPAALAPTGEPKGLAWLSADEIETEMIAPGRATVALTKMLPRCVALVRQLSGLRGE
ncbi:MAG: NUDIX domain-containing protein [Anaerolineae bacterium]|nr:NUDIX domain-containing protein [Anaerolineae bacterium]